MLAWKTTICRDCFLPSGVLLVIVTAGGTGHNCTSSCGSTLPSAPSALCRWKSEWFSLPQQKQTLCSTYCNLGSGSWQAPGVPKEIRQVVPGRLSHHCSPTNTCQPPVSILLSLSQPPPQGLSGCLCFIFILCPPFM